MLRQRRPPPADIHASVVAFAIARGHGRPLFIGDVCLHMGWWATLRDAESVLEALVTDGLIEPMSDSECAQRGIAHAYKLVSGVVV